MQGPPVFVGCGSGHVFLRRPLPGTESSFFVIGIKRTGHGDDLKAMGADVVVTDFSVVRVENHDPGDEMSVPSALDRMQDILSKIAKR